MLTVFLNTYKSKISIEVRNLDVADWTPRSRWIQLNRSKRGRQPTKMLATLKTIKNIKNQLTRPKHPNHSRCLSPSRSIPNIQPAVTSCYTHTPSVKLNSMTPSLNTPYSKTPRSVMLRHPACAIHTVTQR